MRTLHRTWLTDHLESLNHFRLPSYLKRRYYRDEWSYEEIADELGVSTGTVGRWMRELGISFRQVAFEAMENDPDLRVRLRVVGGRAS